MGGSDEAKTRAEGSVLRAIRVPKEPVLGDSPEQAGVADGSGDNAGLDSTNERTAAVRLLPDRLVRPRFAEGTAIGHYEIIRPLGKGGMGDVYLARDTRLGRRVALKFLQRVDPQHTARFTVEARATAQLSHESIVALYDVADHGGFPYMVLEYVPGKTLLAWLRQRRKVNSMTVSPSRAAELMLPVARALQCAHEAGIVHRDLKPANIMLAENGTVKVLDFGIAKLIGDATGMDPADDEALAREEDEPELADSQNEVSSTGTRASVLIGTQPFMAPEQWRSEPVDGRADLWAIGIILYQMVVGEHPLAPLSPEVLAGVRVLSTPMPRLRERLPEIGKLGEVVDRCLRKHPADRLSSARELCGELEAIARPAASPLPGRGEDDSPYAGLAAFQERDAARFFARETMIEQVVARLSEHPLLALVGSSGSGKSSLVRAGVIPALKRGGDAWEAFVLRPGPRPLSVLADLLLQHSWHRVSPSASAARQVDSALLPIPRHHDAGHAMMTDQLRNEPGFFGMQVRSRARRRLERVVLFVDQFEEVYTLAPEHERDAFLACLAGAADDASSPLRVIASIRHDFLDRVAASSSLLAELVSRGTVLVGPLERSGLRRALVAPTEAHAYRFESEALISQMLDSLVGAASALPLLQFTASKLWEGRDQSQRMLTEASYRAFGGVSGALASHADQVLGAMSSAERQCARTLLLRLVTPERTRAIVTRRELSELGAATAAELERVVDRLIEARLLTVDGAGRDGSTVELLHESLIKTWPALSQWLEEEQGDAQFRERLRVAAREWEASNHAEGMLWRAEAEVDARSWKQRHRISASQLSAREERYLTAVLNLGQRERRRKRQIMATLYAAMIIVVIVVSALAIRSNRAANRADRQRADAERSAASARNATRMATARERQEDPTTVLALLREIEPGPPPRGWAELARWASQAGVASVVLQHDDEVRSAAFSPDGKRIATASVDKLVRIWNADGTGQPLLLRGHEDRANSAMFSPDGRRVVSASRDNTVRIWNADGSGSPVVLRGHSERVVAAVWSPDGQRIVSGSYDKTVRIWRADGTGQPIILTGHEDYVTAVAWSPNGKQLASASYDKTVRIWNVDSSEKPLLLLGHGAGVTAVSFSPDSRRIASASNDKTVRIWPTDGSRVPLLLEGHDSNVVSVAWSPDGKSVASASIDKTVRIWRTDGSAPPQVFRGHAGYLTSVTFSADGRRIASASWDKTVRIWATDTSRLPLVLRGHDEPVYGAAFSPDGRHIASASWDKTVRVWSADGSGAPLVLRGHEALVLAAEFSPDGRRIVSASFDKTLRVWNADGSGQPLILRGHDSVVMSAAFSPDGSRIVSASWDKTVRVWNSDGSGLPIVLGGHDDRVTSAAFSPDGSRIASASWDKTVRVWRSDGSEAPLILRGHEDRVTSVAFSPDGTRIVSASDDKTVRVWNADGSGQPLILRGHEALALVRGARPFSPDGSRIVSCSEDGTVRVWNADGSGEPLVLRASNAELRMASWSPDGKRIIASSDDKTLIVWSELDPIRDAADPKLWTATTYCIPLQIRHRLLGFSDQQSQADLARCHRGVAALQGIPPVQPGPR
jgi:WD40 repeat protein/serine/threonine protein kinase